ncbi:GatB/YqeY domain-containing protein [Kallotenue papyrolyticum]|uniref:GatB/YqeY domain-containing protein n=1 Tax=Kallotenue papyrolyticum TaxID=1325125 RepID=UPI0004785480|nr:GatB/YqeY domain-containing protein [Kallotenue papyrolyticum]
MNLAERLQADLKDAMRAKDELRLTTIRSLRAAIKNEEVAKRTRERSAVVQRLAQERGVSPDTIAASELPEGEPLSDAEIQQVVRSEIKRRQDAAATYRQVGRADAAEREEAEIAILQQYLPRQLSAEELRPLVQAVIEEVGATGKADLKKVMPVLMSRYRDRADGRLLNQLAQELLA